MVMKMYLPGALLLALVMETILMMGSLATVTTAAKAPKIDGDCPNEWEVTEDPPAVCASRYYVSPYSLEAYPTFSKLTLDLGAARDEIHRLQKGRRCLSQKLAKQKFEFDTYKTKSEAAHAVEMDTMKEQHKVLKDQHEALKDQYEADISEVKSKLQTFDQAVKQLKRENIALKQKDTTLDSNVATLETKTVALEEQVARGQAFLATNLYDNTPSIGDILRFKDVKLGHDSYATSSGKFTAKYSGTYLMTFTMWASTTSGSRSAAYVYLYVNDVKYLRSGTLVDNSGDYQSATLTAVVALQKGQTLDVRAADSKMKISNWQYDPFFSVTLVHSA